MDKDIAIDIHYDKLLDWLVSRHKVASKWAPELKAVKARVATATQNLPNAQDVKDVVNDGGDMTFSKCVAVLDMLKRRAEASGDSGKTFFGNYSNAHLQEWDSLVRDYQRGCLHLAEAARVMTQATDFDLPDLKANLASFKKQLAEQRRKAMDVDKTIEAEKRRLSETCATTGIPGNGNYKSELQSLTRLLPTQLFDVECAVRDEDVGRAATVYCAFSQVVARQVADAKYDGGVDGDAGKAAVASAQSRVSTLVGLLDSPAPPKPSDTEEADLTASFDVVDGGEWEITMEGSGGEGGGVDWGISLEDSGAEAGAGAGAGAGSGGGGEEASAIDWGFGVTEVGSSAPAATESGSGSGSGSGGGSGGGDGVDKSALAPYALSNDDTRTAVVDDLVELQAFLVQRVTETKKGGMSFLDDVSALPPVLGSLDLAQLERMLAAVTKALDLVQGERLHQLLSLQNSPRYLERLCSQFTRRERQIQKLKARAKDTRTRQEELLDSIAKTQPQFASGLEDVMKVKKMVEDHISAMFNGRSVHIIGAINTLA